MVQFEPGDDELGRAAQQVVCRNRSAFEVLVSFLSPVAFHLFCRVLYDEGYATVPKLAEKLTLELVHHIQVNTSYWFSEL